MEHKYKPGDKIRIKSLEKFNCNQIQPLTTAMKQLCGTYVVYKEPYMADFRSFRDTNGWIWRKEAIEEDLEIIKEQIKKEIYG
jgi:hypothetical protein